MIVSTHPIVVSSRPVSIIRCARDSRAGSRCSRSAARRRRSHSAPYSSSAVSSRNPAATRGRANASSNTPPSATPARAAGTDPTASSATVRRARDASPSARTPTPNERVARYQRSPAK